MKHNVLNSIRPLLGAAAAGGLAIALVGCFGDFALNAPAQDSVDAVKQPVRSISLQVLPAGSAKLLSENYGNSAAKQMDKGGGELKVDCKGGKGSGDDVEVNFRVPKDALSSETEIAMAVSNPGVDLVVAFAPDGLTFGKNATLTLRLGKDLIDPAAAIAVFHEHGGVVDNASFTVNESDKSVTIRIDVPGFSRYGLAD